MHKNFVYTASKTWSCFWDLLILLYAGEMGRKCIQVGANLLAAYAINLI